jgi:hypothetical protein
MRRVESDLQSATFRADSQRESSEGQHDRALNSSRPFKLISTNNEYYVETSQKGSAQSSGRQTAMPKTKTLTSSSSQAAILKEFQQKVRENGGRISPKDFKK